MKKTIFMALVLLAGLLPSMACDTPVFRYALEKWEPESYPAFVFLEDSLTAEEAAAMAPLNQLSGNLTVERVNIAKLAAGFDAAPYEFKWLKKKYRKSKDQLNAEQKRAAAERAFRYKRSMVERFGQGKPLPYAVVCFPSEIENGLSKAGDVLWEGVPDAQVFAALAESPTRTEIANRILDGDSAVWLMLPSGEAEKDEACLARLNEMLRTAERTVELSIPGKDDTISGGVPLRLSFSTLRVDPSVPEEAFFIQTLRKLREKRGALGGKHLSCCPAPSASVSPQGCDAKFPVVIPIIGRGRAIEWVTGEQINEEYIIELCRYISGPCSCEIKNQNPGMDMLFSVDWESRFVPMMGPDEGPGELKGLGGMLKKDDDV